MTSWLERKIHRYERMRFAQEPNRRTLPFDWGLEHIGGASHPEPRSFLERFVTEAVAQSDDWYAVTPASDYALADNVLTFTSAIASPWPENNRVHAQLFPARRNDKAKGPAIYRDRDWPKPTTPPLHMTMDEADAVPAYFPIKAPTTYDLGPIKATINPRNLPQDDSETYPSRHLL